MAIQNLRFADLIEFWQSDYEVFVFLLSGAFFALLGWYYDRRRFKRIGSWCDRFFDFPLDMLCIIGKDGYIKEVNAAWEHILGFAIAESKSRLLLEFVHPDDRDATKAQIQKWMETGENTLGFENRCLCKDGSYKWLSWNVQVYPEERLTYAIVRDISDRKQIEKALII